ncbi:glycoside hydrolase [Pseudohalioglobus sediminis]|uniref:Glycoside hydrolase n=1 Tax=Pseudohalioglobus sediminis TaxID=2606449 RepID=A0A5B0WQ31_9GAMM|nr:glycoside hydrolase family 57 protein [Pseudohalioglobus sediminis]KAA1189160.1 glycoside hydrolase [Pseudohalioglobus sediminis]
MPSDKPMKVALCWHMHQPEYRNMGTGTFQLPWTYLHAVKDYVDMAAHLEALPRARAVVNFAPILLEQIEAYVAQVNAFFNGRGAIKDALLANLVEPALPGDPDSRLELMKRCLQANREHMIERFAPYHRLADLAQYYQAHPESLIYASNQFLADLLVWYHLAWVAESARRQDPRVQALQDKGYNYTIHERRELLHVLLELMQSVIPRYRALARSGQVELTMSPYAHPIVPLLLDMESAREAMPDAHLPINTTYPGGEERARWHLQQGLATFERVFSTRPAGIWPSEGGVSQAALELFAEAGFTWAASGAAVLNNSHQAENHSCSHRVYRFGDADIDCVFRDDGLSDLIGFTYSDWHSEDAVANLTGHMEHIAELCQDRDDCMITIILDGENAWEYYPENAWYFLDHLYRALLDNPKLELTTVADFISTSKPQPSHEEKLVAGSWVYGTFSTWIGAPEKNRAWDLLVDAKHCFDEVVASGSLGQEQLRDATRQLAICEGSDWFWWFGDYNPGPTVSQFDQLYRMHLAHLYYLLGVEAPGNLSEVISRGGGQPSRGGVMRHHDQDTA